MWQKHVCRCMCIIHGISQWSKLSILLAWHLRDRPEVLQELLRGLTCQFWHFHSFYSCYLFSISLSCCRAVCLAKCTASTLLHKNSMSMEPQGLTALNLNGSEGSQRLLTAGCGAPCTQFHKPATLDPFTGCGVALSREIGTVSSKQWSTVELCRAVPRKHRPTWRNGTGGVQSTLDGVGLQGRFSFKHTQILPDSAQAHEVPWCWVPVHHGD